MLELPRHIKCEADCLCGVLLALLERKGQLRNEVVQQFGAVNQTPKRIIHGRCDGVVRLSLLASPRPKQPHWERTAPANTARLLRQVVQRVFERQAHGADGRIGSYEG